jgi:hypothetical protein
MVNRVLIYTFPFFLLVMEWLLRVSMQIDSREFVGPTIAAAALGLLLPLTAFKNRDDELSADTKAELDALKGEFVPRREKRLVEIVWLSIIVCLAVWGCCLVFACKPEHNPINISPVYYSLASYFVAVIFSEIREAL